MGKSFFGPSHRIPCLRCAVTPSLYRQEDCSSSRPTGSLPVPPRQGRRSCRNSFSNRTPPSTPSPKHWLRVPNTTLIWVNCRNRLSQQAGISLEPSVPTSPPFWMFMNGARSLGLREAPERIARRHQNSPRNCPPACAATARIKALEFILAGNGQPPVTIPGSLASGGVLLLTAFLTLAYTQTQDLLLFEEPENGLHPTRLQMVVDILRNEPGEVGSRNARSLSPPTIL